MFREDVPGSSENGDESADNIRGRIRLNRRDWLKVGSAAIGSSMVGLSQGVTRTAASLDATSQESDDYENLASEVPQRAYDVWDAKPDVREEFDVWDADDYKSRNGDLAERIEEAAANDAIVDLEDGVYEMNSAVDENVHSGTVGIVGDGARIYYVGTHVSTLFSISPDYAVMEGVTFDITENPDNGNTDVGIVATFGGIGERGWFEDIRLEGQRHRRQDLGDGISQVGAFSTFHVNALEGATCFVHRCELPDGGTDMSQEMGTTSGHAIGFSAGPDNHGLTVWKDCYAEEFWSNGYYLTDDDATGENIAWNCEAINCGRGGVRIGSNDTVIGGRTEVTKELPGDITGQPFVHNYGDNATVIGLEVVVDSSSLYDAIQMRSDAEEIDIERLVLDVRGSDVRPIRTSASTATFRDCYIRDEGSNEVTFDISFAFDSPSTVILEEDVRLEAAETGHEFLIGSHGTLEGSDGTRYSDTSVSPDDLGLESPTNENGELPTFYFDYDEDGEVSDSASPTSDDEDQDEWFEDFADSTVGSEPEGWDSLTGSDFEVVDASGPVDNAEVELQSGESTAHILEWNDVDEFADGEVASVYDASTTTGNHHRLFLRTQNGGDDAYFLEPCPNTNGIMIRRYSEGNLTTLETASKPLDKDGHLYARFRVDGDELKGNAWNAGDGEPDEWDVETTSTDVEGAGAPAIGTFNGPGERWSVVSAATGAASASLPDTLPDTDRDGTVDRPTDTRVTPNTTTPSGVRVEVQEDLGGFELTLSENTTGADTAEITNSLSEPLAQKDISRLDPGDSFEIEHDLEVGEEYIVLVSADDSYDRGDYDDPDWPYDSDQFQVLEGIWGRDNSTAEHFYAYTKLTGLQ